MALHTIINVFTIFAKWSLSVHGMIQRLPFEIDQIESIRRLSYAQSGMDRKCLPFLTMDQYENDKILFWMLFLFYFWNVGQG